MSIETDLDLFVNAAVAAGIPGFFGVDYQGPYFCTPATPTEPRSEPVIYRWASDYGDAFMLATKLGLSIEPYPYYDDPKHAVVVKKRRRSDQLREANPTEVVMQYGGDPNAATCRAILCAAAAIGRAMP